MAPPRFADSACDLDSVFAFQFWAFFPVDRSKTGWPQDRIGDKQPKSHQ